MKGYLKFLCIFSLDDLNLCTLKAILHQRLAETLLLARKAVIHLNPEVTLSRKCCCLTVIINELS